MNIRADFIDEKMVEEEISLVIEIQFLIQKTMNEKGLSRADLAKKLGISRARLTQLMKPEANPTLHTLADIFYVMGEQLRFECDGPMVTSEMQSHADWMEMVTPLRVPPPTETSERVRKLIAGMRDRSPSDAANDSVAFINDPDCLAA